MVRRLFTVLAALTLVMAVAACGFEPMYGARTTSGSTVADLSAVEVAPIVDAEGAAYRLGHLMSNALGERFYAFGIAQPRYRLEVTLNREVEGFAFRPDEAVTRYGMRLTAAYRLRDLADDRIVLEDTARTYNSYDVVQSDFATLMAERNMEERLSQDLSERITSRLGKYFRDRPADTAKVSE